MYLLRKYTKHFSIDNIQYRKIIKYFSIVFSVTLSVILYISPARLLHDRSETYLGIFEVGSDGSPNRLCGL